MPTADRTSLCSRAPTAPARRSWVWPALCWNFLDDGWIDPPHGAGISGGYVFCGVLFFVLGASPLRLGFFALRQSAHRPGGRGAAAQAGAHGRGHHALPARHTSGAPHLRRATPPAPRPPAPRVEVPAPIRSDLPVGDVPDAVASLAGRLERLAALHATGALTDEEFRRATSATLPEEIDR